MKENESLVDVFDRVATVYDTVEPRFFATVAHRLVAKIRLSPGSRVLDVATGPGVVLSEIARTGIAGLELTGVDRSAGMIRAARTRLSAAGVRADLRMMDAEALDFPTGAFDIVTMSRAYLLPRRAAILREIHRVLKLHARFAVAEFGDLDDRWAWKDALYARLSPTPSGPVGGRPAFDAATLRGELGAAGFDPVDLEAERLDVVFDDLAHWWASSMTHGERRALERMTPEARQAFFEQADVAACREADGKLHWRPDVLYAVAVRSEFAEERRASSATVG